MKRAAAVFGILGVLLLAYCLYVYLDGARFQSAGKEQFHRQAESATPPMTELAPPAKVEPAPPVRGEPMALLTIPRIGRPDAPADRHRGVPTPGDTQILFAADWLDDLWHRQPAERYIDRSAGECLVDRDRSHSVRGTVPRYNGAGMVQHLHPHRQRCAAELQQSSGASGMDAPAERLCRADSKRTLAGLSTSPPARRQCKPVESVRHSRTVSLLAIRAGVQYRQHSLVRAQRIGRRHQHQCHQPGFRNLEPPAR